MTSNPRRRAVSASRVAFVFPGPLCKRCANILRFSGIVDLGVEGQA